MDKNLYTMNIKLENLKRDEALRLLQYIRDNVTPSCGIQGGEECRYMWTDTFLVTVIPDLSSEGHNFNKNTLVIQSNYWLESSMIKWLPEEYKAAARSTIEIPVDKAKELRIIYL